MATRSRGRPRKYSIGDARQRLLDAGLDALRENGVRSGLDAVTLDDAIATSEVPRGSAYELWRSDDTSPQEAFREAVVIHILSMPATVGLPATREFTMERLNPVLETVQTGTPEERHPIMLEMMRIVGGFNFDLLDSGNTWPIYSALRTAAVTRPDTSPAILEAVRRGEEYLIEQYATLYTELAKVFRVRLRPEFTMHEFAACMYAVNEGLANRVATNYRRRGITLTTGMDGSDREWSLAAVAFDALATRFFVAEELAEF